MYTLIIRRCASFTF